MRARSAAPPHLADVRTLLSEDYRDLPDEELAEALGRFLGSEAPGEAGEFLSQLGDIGRAIVTALPAVLPVVGTAIGGPIGGVAGAAGGAALGAATQQKPVRRALGFRGKKPGRRGPGARGPLGKPATTHAPAPAPAPVGSPAAGQLLALLYRPELLQALVSLLMGRAGSPEVEVAGTPVPAAAFLNLVGALADRAADQHHDATAFRSEGVPTYLLDEGGALRCDAAVPEERAEVLWELLHAACEDEDEDDGPAEWDEMLLRDEWLAAFEEEELYESEEEA